MIALVLALVLPMDPPADLPEWEVQYSERVEYVDSVACTLEVHDLLWFREDASQPWVLTEDVNAGSGLATALQCPDWHQDETGVWAYLPPVVEEPEEPEVPMDPETPAPVNEDVKVGIFAPVKVGLAVTS